VPEGSEHRERGGGGVVPETGVPPNLQMGETRILIRFLGCIFHGTGNSARLCQNFEIISGGGGFNLPNPPFGYASGCLEGSGVPVLYIGRTDPK
jgi:hypothetical protein